MKTTSLSYKWLLRGSTNIVKSFVCTECDREGSHSRVNTHLSIIPIKYMNSAPRQDCARPSQSRDTSWQSSDHGDALTVTTHWGRCCSQTSALTNSTPHATISCIKACSLPPVLLHQSLYYCVKKTRMHNQSTNTLQQQSQWQEPAVCPMF